MISPGVPALTGGDDRCERSCAALTGMGLLLGIMEHSSGTLITLSVEASGKRVISLERVEDLF